MKHFLPYIFLSLSFLVSFVYSAGELNNNSYVKEFALGVVLVGQMVTTMFNKRSWSSITLKLKWADVVVILLMSIYVMFFIRTANPIDFTLPFVYFSTYFFFRIYFQENTSDVEKIIIQIIPFVLCVHYLITILQLLHILPNLHDFFPAGSTFGNPDKLASYLAILLPVCFAKNTRRIPGYILLTVGVVLFIILQARTALIATAVTFICFLFLEKKISKRALSVGITACFVLFIALIWWHPDSVSGRIFCWIVATCMLFSKPQGYGLYAFQKHFPEAQAEFIVTHPDLSYWANIDQVVYSPFNEFINIGVSIGIIGLLLYLLFAKIIIGLAFRNRISLIYPVIAFLVISLSYFPMKIAPIGILMVMISAIIVSRASMKIIISINFIKNIGLIAFASIACCISLINQHTFCRWEKATEKTDMNAGITREYLFTKSYSRLKGNGLFLFSYADYSYSNGDRRKAMSLLTEADKYYAGVNSSLFLSSLYEENGEADKAEGQLKKAMELSNGQYYPTYMMILFLDKVGRTDEAYRLAVELYSRPVTNNHYADVDIIRIRIKEFIDKYTER